MSIKQTVLVFGAGPRNGAGVIAAFEKIGWNIATVSRKGTNSTNEQGHLSLKADFANPDLAGISALFDAVEEKFHIPPSVVVYNAAALTAPSDKDSVLSIPQASLSADLNVNVVTPFVVAQEAVKRWEGMPKEQNKLFIYTGNGQNEQVWHMPLMLSLGIGKSASAYWIAVADAAYADKRYRFIYADQRQEDGSPPGPNLDGPAHGAFYTHLATTGAEKVPWQATFVKDKAYVKF